MRRAAKPQTIRQVLACSRLLSTCFLKPRVRGAQGVFSLDDVYGSPARSWPGKPPLDVRQYVPNARDAGPVESAKVLTARDAALLMSYRNDLPHASAATLQLWIANLVMPDVAHGVLLAIWASGLLDLARDAPVRESVAVGADQRHDGFAVSHDLDAPVPEWLAPDSAASVCSEGSDGGADSTPLTSLVLRAVRREPAPAQAGEHVPTRLSLHEVDEQDDDEEAIAASFTQGTVSNAACRHNGPSPEGGEEVQRAPTAALRAVSDSAENGTMPAASVAACAVSLMPGERLVEGTGEPSKQRYIEMVTRMPAEVGSRVKERSFETLVDNGASVSLLSSSQRTKLPPNALCPLQDGDFRSIVLANDETRIPILGTVVLTLRYPQELMRHKFYITDIPVQAIPGSDFFGKFGSDVAYSSMQLHPRGKDGPAVPMHERKVSNAQKVCNARGSREAVSGSPAQRQPSALPQKRSAVLMEDVVLRPFSEEMIEVAVHPPLKEGLVYDALLYPGQSQKMESLQSQGLRVAFAAVTVAPNNPVAARVVNISPTPLLLRRRAFVGTLVPAEGDDILNTPETLDEQELRTELPKRALRYAVKCRDDEDFRQATEEVLASLTAESERAESPHQTDDTTDDGVAPISSYATVSALCDEQELREMLLQDGQPNPVLDAKAPDGRRWADWVMEVLLARRAVFPKDLKNPHVTNVTQFDVNTGDAQPVAAKARRWPKMEAEYILQQVAQMRARKQVEPFNSPWASNPVLARQGDKIRFCVDYRKLNSVTKRDSHGLGNIDDMLQRV